MRLGSKIAIVGIVLLILGASQPAVHESTEWRCEPGYFGDCGNVTTYEPNHGRSLFMGLGGLLFVTGLGGWIGTYDAENRQQRREMQEKVEQIEQAEPSDD